MQSAPQLAETTTIAAAPELAFIPLASLAIHPDNVRKTPLSEAEQEEITSSIAGQGLIEPLVCIRQNEQSDSYLVIAGGRRLTSLQILNGTNRLPASLHKGIPCQIFPADTDVTLVSLTENQIRFSMNPADQIVAWRELFTNGYDVDDIASRFGQHPKLVERRLKLSGLIPEVLDLLRNGDISLSVAKAFSLLGDELRQQAALTCFESPEEINEYDIRRMISSAQCTMAGNKAQIVGLKPYTDAGGTFVEDLFSDRDDGGQIMIADPDLLDSLFTTKCEHIETDLLEKGWKWVEVVENYNSSRLYNTTSIPEPNPQPTEDEEDRMEHVERLLTDPAMTESMTSLAILQLEAERRHLFDLGAERAFSPEDKAKSGVVVQIKDGRIYHHFGRIEPKRTTTQTVSKPKPDVTNPGTLYSQALSDDIAAIRTDIVRGTLLDHPRLCIDMLAFQLANLHADSYTSLCSIEQRSCMSSSFSDRPMADKFEAFWTSLDRSWLDHDEDWERFRAFRALDDNEKDQWLSWAVITSFSAWPARKDPTDSTEALIAMLDIDWTRHWRPDEAFWKRVSKPAMAEMLAPVIGDDWFKNHSGISKGEMARLLGDICTGNSNQISATKANAVAQWQIAGLEPCRTHDEVEDDHVIGNDTQPAAASEDQGPAFRVTKALLTPACGPDGQIIVQTEEISSEIHQNGKIISETEAAESDTSSDGQLSYAEASQTGTQPGAVLSGRAISDPDIIKERLGAVAGSEEATMIDALDGTISMIDMTSSSAGHESEADQDTSQTPATAMAQPDDGLELPAFLRRG